MNYRFIFRSYSRMKLIEQHFKKEHLINVKSALFI